MNKLKRYALLLFGLSAIFPTLADTATMQTCEYWIDGQYEAKNTMTFSGEWKTELDMSNLCEGVHTLAMRFSDSKNRWSSPITRYFMRTVKGTADATLKGYRYWIDGDFNNGVNAEFADNGIIQLEFDMSALCEGIHTLAVQTEDSYGRKSSPITRYFMVIGKNYNDATLKGYRYWIDGNFDNAVNGKFTDNGIIQLELDMSTLYEGIHTLAIQTEDNYGRKSSPITRYFMVTGKNYNDATLKGYRYWIDGDFDNGVNGEFADNGIIQLELDMSALCEGVHTLAVQTEDNYGRKSSPITRYFMVTGKKLTDNKISAYEYWFNKGNRVRVEIDPVNPFELEEQIIEIADVIPNKIPDSYRFDISTETAWCKDDVNFGMQVFDLAGNATPAIMSDTFSMDVPVKINFTELSNGIETDFEAPQPGFISGFYMKAEAGDSLNWEISPNCTLDLFSEKGERIAYKNQQLTNGNKWCKIKAESTMTYALVHSVSSFATDMSVTCTRIEFSDLVNNEDHSNVRIFTNNGTLIIECTKETPIRITNTTGVILVYDTKALGTNRYSLSSGVYIVQAGDKTMKVLL